MQTIDELFREYYADLFRYALFLEKDIQHAEDLLMETFTKAITASSRFRGEATVKTWLFGIMRNLWLQKLRKKRLPEEEAQMLSYWEIPLEEHIDRRELLFTVHRLMAQKSERERNVFYMRVAGYSYAEIGEHLAISENSARVIEFRVRKSLISELEKEELL